MEIKIDTQRDTEEHIRHAIRLLQSLVQGKESFTNETASGQTAPPSGLMNMFGDNSSSSYGGEEVEESVGEDSTYPDMVAEPEVGRASRYPDQSGFSSYGSTESAPRMPTKEEAPPGSLFGMFKDATMKKRDDPNKVIPY